MLYFSRCFTQYDSPSFCRLACIAIQQLTTGSLRAKVPMQRLRGLLANVVAAIQAVSEICSNEKAVTEMLYDFLTQQLLQTASK